jgi:hypothetical protein
MEVMSRRVAVRPRVRRPCWSLFLIWSLLGRTRSPNGLRLETRLASVRDSSRPGGCHVRRRACPLAAIRVLAAGELGGGRGWGRGTTSGSQSLSTVSRSRPASAAKAWRTTVTGSKAGDWAFARAGRCTPPPVVVAGAREGSPARDGPQARAGARGLIRPRCLPRRWSGRTLGRCR